MKRASVREQVRYPAGVTAGLAAAVVLCLWGAVQSYSTEAAYQQANSDPYMVSMQFQRFAQVPEMVPRDAVMGYLSDAPSGVVDTAMFDSAQYVLAPRILERGAAHDWVLGNFTRPGDFHSVAQANGLRLERDFGNGAILFRREEHR